MQLRIQHTRIIVPALMVLFLSTAGCFGPSDEDRIDAVKDDLVLHLEGKDATSILAHTPDDLSTMKISMDSGDYVVNPDSISELEEGLWDFSTVFNGDDLELTQQNITVTGDTGRVNLTFQVMEDDWKRTVPVRMDMRRVEDRWIMVGLHAFN